MNSFHERRRHVRYLCSAVAEILIKTGPSAGASYAALINDICVKGVRLSMDGSIAVGAEIVVTVPGEAEFTGAVRHVSQDDREFNIGVEFTIGEWNEQSEWPSDRWLTGQQAPVCEPCPGAKELALS
jgi:hypothetical protein